MPDARKTLEVLHEEWAGCTRCALGKNRQNVGGQIVFGEGVGGGILFVGEGPGKTEEQEGRPFVGKSGAILRGVLQRLNFTEYFITNGVACRSCEPLLDPNTNLPVTRKNFHSKQLEIVWKDCPPPPPAVAACRPRLQEEIYIMDPVLIVSLGAEAAEALTGGKVAILAERGKERHISIDGASFRAVLTEKRGAWRRKVKGQMVAPTEPNEVQYLLVPTLHPSYVGRKLGDKSPNSPFQQFVGDLKKAVAIYERYVQEVLGTTLRERDEPDASELDEYQQQLEEDQSYGS